MKTTSALLGLVLALTTVSVRADFWHEPPRGQPLQLEYDAGAAFLSGSRLSLGTAHLGNIESTHSHLVVGMAARATDDFTYRVAGEYRRNDFSLSPGVPIPKLLGNAGLQLTGNLTLTKDLSLWANARPGVYSDFRNLSWGDVNVPFNVVMAWQQNEDLLWLLGVYVDLRADFPVFGGPGVRWHFADDWTLNLVMPRPRIELRASDSLMLYACGELREVSYRTARDFGTSVGNPALNNRMLDYRDMRLGGGMTYSFSRHINLGLEGGYVIERRFNYYGAHTQLTDNGAGYVSASLNGKF
ncbi:MAG: hypothetical protein EBS05_20095 [Proteobacteria bacterium]|nr:hypothetical protein [Pseudomonadota bacterium]